MASSLDEFLNLTEAVQDAGYGLETFRDVPTEKVYEALNRAGYSEVRTNSGQTMWTKPWWNTTGATSTATAGKTMGQDLVSTVTTEAGSGAGLVNITASSVGLTTEATSVTQGVAMIAKTPKLAVLTAVASACGLSFGFDLGQELVDQYFGDDNFDWSTDSIGAKVISYVSGDKTYVSEDLINRIKDRFIDIGAFEDGSVVIPESVDYNNLETFDLQTFFAYCINSITSDSVKRTLTLAITQVPMEDLGGYIEMSFDTSFSTYWSFTIKITNSKSIEGDKPVLVNDDILSKDFYGYKNNNNTHKIISNHGYIYNINGTSYSDKVNYETNEVFNNIIVGSYSGNLICLTNIGSYTTGGIPGIKKQPNATYPTKGTPVATTYPDWGTDRGKVPTKDSEKAVLPLKLPKPDEGTKPQPEAQKGTYPEPDPYIDDLIDGDEIPQPPVPTEDTGDTPTPPIPAIGAEATGFVAIYNPTQKQLSDFSRYLWSNEFLDNFIKLFANPMDAIIGLHMIYATPSRGTDAEIVCGYAHSRVISKTVNKQYIELDCGSIKVNRYFDTVLDYAPYTTLQAYLPFVGIVDLDVNEIMDGTLNIKYRIDVLTGSCLARLKVTRGDYTAELYNFAGNCAVQLPISGGSYSGIIANAIGVAGSIGATIATGGAMAPVLVGSVVSSATNSHVNVSHSGSLGSNAGALGIMKPYLIITRPKPAEADSYSKFYGIPSNKTVRLSSCSGFTRVKDIHLEHISRATDDELNEIESLLKTGVII